MTAGSSVIGSSVAGSSDIRSTVLVTDADRGSAVAIIRSLGRQGWRVIAADTNPKSLGFRSRYCHERLVYPEPATAPDRFVDTLHRTVVEQQVTLVVPVTDEVIQPLVHARRRFEDGCRLAIPEFAALDHTTDKSKTLTLAQRLGVPVPPTRVVRTVEEARTAAAALRWPLVVKPAVSRKLDQERGVIESFTVSYANSLEELLERMRAFDGRHDVLLQEYCEGVGHGVEILASEGRVLAAFQHKRLAELPLTGGVSAWRESVALDPVLYGHAARLVEAVRWTGLLMVEFKVGVDARLMEINGRIWGSLPLAVLSGMDFPARLAELYSTGPPAVSKPDTDYRIGVRAYNRELMLKWIVRVLFGRQRCRFLPAPKRRQVGAALVARLSPNQKSDLSCPEDRRPAVAELFKIARKLFVTRKRATQ